ncbi:MAG: hypothetical protein U0263_40490 [Polyangiaceae bacterium]
MKHPMCPRAWEVEAARDGRLLGEALASTNVIARLVLAVSASTNSRAA